jgi:ABC-type sugar transport system substrate-binding protein
MAAINGAWRSRAIVVSVVLALALAAMAATSAAAGNGKHKGESKKDFGHLWRSCNHQMEGGVKAHGGFKYAGHSKNPTAFNAKENCVQNGGHPW